MSKEQNIPFQVAKSKVVFAVENGLDFATTAIGLHNPQNHEQMDRVALIIQQHGMEGFAVTKIALTLAVVGSAAGLEFAARRLRKRHRYEREAHILETVKNAGMILFNTEYAVIVGANLEQIIATS